MNFATTRILKFIPFLSFCLMNGRPFGIEYGDSLRIVEKRNVMFLNIQVQEENNVMRSDMTLGLHGNVGYRKKVSLKTIYRIPDVYEMTDSELMNSYAIIERIDYEEDTGSKNNLNSGETEKSNLSTEANLEKDKTNNNGLENSEELKKEADLNSENDVEKIKDLKNKTNESEKNKKQVHGDDIETTDEEKIKDGKETNQSKQNEEQAKNDTENIDEDKKIKSTDVNGELQDIDILKNTYKTSYIYIKDFETPFLKESLNFFFLKNVSNLEYCNTIISQRDYIQNQEISARTASSFSNLTNVNVKYVVPESVCIVAELVKTIKTNRVKEYTVINTSGSKTVLSTFYFENKVEDEILTTTIKNENLEEFDSLSDYKIGNFIMNWFKEKIISLAQSKIGNKKVIFYPNYDRNSINAELKLIKSDKVNSLIREGNNEDFLYCDLTKDYENIRDDILIKSITYDEILEIKFYNEIGDVFCVLHSIKLDCEELWKNLENFIDSNKPSINIKKDSIVYLYGIYSKNIFSDIEGSFNEGDDLVASGASILHDARFILEDKRIYPQKTDVTSKNTNMKITPKKYLEINKKTKENINKIIHEISIKKAFEELVVKEIKLDYINDKVRIDELNQMIQVCKMNNNLSSKEVILKMHQILVSENNRNKVAHLRLERYTRLMKETFDNYSNKVKEWNNNKINELYESALKWFESFKAKKDSKNNVNESVETENSKNVCISSAEIEEKYLDLKSSLQAHENKIINEKLEAELKLLEEQKKLEEEKKKIEANKSKEGVKEEEKKKSEENDKESIKEDDEKSTLEDNNVEKLEETVPSPLVNDQKEFSSEKSRVDL